MMGEQTNNEGSTRANNQGVLQSFTLPDDIDDLIEASGTYSPDDVWMEYLATLPVDTPTPELHRLRQQFAIAVAEYMGVDE